MITKELSEAAVEFNYILDNSSYELRKKIPQKFINYMRNIASTTYVFNYDNSKKMNEQNLKAETRGIIALVYQDYICTEEEKKEYMIKCHDYEIEKEKKLREKYNPDNIFKKHNKENEIIENSIQKEVSLVEYKESIFRKVINKIKSIFHIK